jgi:hypothetical protein
LIRLSLIRGKSGWLLFLAAHTIEIVLPRRRMI